ncbi:hypothetical protein J6N69_02605 [bacterium]|nr:hypothetical protein [bacterium]MBP3847590.1 hypothetical protein [bacterium]
MFKSCHPDHFKGSTLVESFLLAICDDSHKQTPFSMLNLSLFDLQKCL